MSENQDYNDEQSHDQNHQQMMGRNGSNQHQDQHNYEEDVSV